MKDHMCSCYLKRTNVQADAVKDMVISQFVYSSADIRTLVQLVSSLIV